MSSHKVLESTKVSVRTRTDKLTAVVRPTRHLEPKCCDHQLQCINNYSARDRALQEESGGAPTALRDRSIDHICLHPSPRRYFFGHARQGDTIVLSGGFAKAT